MKKQNYSVKCTTHLIPKQTKSCMRKSKKNHHTLHGSTVVSHEDVNPEQWPN